MIDLRTALLNERVDRGRVVFSDRPSTPYTPTMQRGLVQAFRQTAGRGGSDPPAHAGATGGRRGPRRTPDRLETLLLTLGVTHHVLALVPLTPLVVPHGRPEPLAAIYDHQKPLGNIEAPPTKDRRNGVNTCSFSVMPPRSRPSSTGERLAVHEGHNVLPGEVPLLEFAEFRRAGLNERAGHRRPRQADRRLGGRRVVAARDPIQHVPQQQVIDGAIAMQRLYDRLALRDIPSAGRPTRPSRGCSHDGARRGVFAGVAFGQRVTSSSSNSSHQPQRNQGPDQFHLGIDLQLRVPLRSMTATAPNVRPFLRFLTDRRTLLISAPFSRGVMVVSQRHQTTGLGAASISN